jgi:hypothetical protein
MVQVPAIAAEYGHTAILKLGKALGLPLLGMTLLGAIKGRNLECLKYAVEFARERLPASAMVFAVAMGYLDGVRYLREAGLSFWTGRDPVDAEGLYALRQQLKPYLEAPTGRSALPAPRLGPRAAPRFAGAHPQGFPGVGAPAGFAGFGGQGFAGAGGPGFAGGLFGHAAPMQPNVVGDNLLDALANLPGVPPGHAQGVHGHAPAPPHGAPVNHVFVPAPHIPGPPQGMQHGHAHPPPHAPHMFGMHGHAQQGQAPLGAAAIAGILGDVMPGNVFGVFMSNAGHMLEIERPITYRSAPVHPLDATWKIAADESRAIAKQPMTRAFEKVQWPPESMKVLLTLFNKLHGTLVDLSSRIVSNGS